MRIPLVIIYAIVALNITAFTGFLLADVLIIKSLVVKVIFSVLSIVAWVLTYINRKKSIKLPI